MHSAETIGMAQRGGSVTSHCRIGDHAFSPLIPEGKADIILAFEPAEAVRNLKYLKECVDAVKDCAEIKGVKAIIFKAPCIAIVKPKATCEISDRCKGKKCRICIKQLGCPAIVMAGDKVVIDKNLCTGCTLCSQVCPHKSIEVINRE